MVVDSFGMDRELVNMAFHLLDRYMAHELSHHQEDAGMTTTTTTTLPATITRDDFQLFSMTCLYMVIKINEIYPRKLGMEALVNMSRGFYSVRDVTLAEQDILKALKWHVNPPTSPSYVRMFLQVFPEHLQSKHMYHIAMTLTELAVAEGKLIGSLQAHVGLASVVYAARLEGVAEDHIQAFLKHIESTVQVHSNADFAHVYRYLEEAYEGS